MTPQQLTREIEDFLAEHPRAAIVEDGEIKFDLATARFNLSGDGAKCVLHLWSEEHNIVRRVIDCERRATSLRLSVQRFGQPKPSVLEICREGDLRSSSEKRSARSVYLRTLQRALLREFPQFMLEKMTATVDLEHSFGPAYARGTMRRGQTAVAFLGVNSSETQPTVDAALSLGVLWLAHCRERDRRGHVEGLMLFAPPGRTALLRSRMAHLDPAMAKFSLHEFSEDDQQFSQLDPGDFGNVSTRIVHLPDRDSARGRFADAISRIQAVVPDCQVAFTSANDVRFRLHGLEFARAGLATVSGSFSSRQQITFGAGAYETTLTEDNSDMFADLMRRVRGARRADGDTRDPLWRMQPERWLEEVVSGDITQIDVSLDHRFVYAQVPAFSAADRGMIDLLTCTREGRLAVVELKADEDLHMPLQGLDYWARVRDHHRQNEFQRFGYFAGRELSPAAPLLVLVAPALRVHPATDTLLRFLSPQIEWMVIGVNEDWRNGVKVVFRKRMQRSALAR